MFDPAIALNAAKLALTIGEKIKSAYDSRFASNSNKITADQVAANLESLQKEVSSQRNRIDSSLAQIDAANENIKQHNEVLLNLSNAIVEMAKDNAISRKIAYISLGTSIVCIIVAIVALMI